MGRLAPRSGGWYAERRAFVHRKKRSILSKQSAFQLTVAVT
jgi:hypothetical protein